MARLSKDTYVASSSHRRRSAAGRRARPTRARCSSRSSRSAKRPPADVVRRGAHAAARRHPGPRGLPPESAEHPHRRTVDQDLYQYTLQSSDINALYANAHQASDGAAEAADDHRCHLGSAQHQPDGATSRSTASAPASFGRHAAQHREHARERVQPAAGLDDLHGDERVLGGDGDCCRARSTTSPTLRNLYVPDDQRPIDAARRTSPRSSAPRRRRSVNHSGQIPSVTISFNLAAERARWAPSSTQVDEIARQMLPATITDGFSGTGAGVPELRSRASASCCWSRSS